MSKITVGRALAARFISRTIKVITVVVSVVLIVILVGTWALAHFVSAWWWLLLVPFGVIALIYFLLRFIVLAVVGKVHPNDLTPEQRAGLDDFTDKIQSLIEARATPPWVFGLLTAKDLIFHRDITTIKRLFSDSVNLRRDYKELEKLFW